MTYKYNAAMRIAHWVIFIALLAMYIAAYIMTDIDASPLKWEIYGLHKATGSILLCLVLLRVYFRIKSQIPKYRDPVKPLNKLVSHTNFKLLYICMILMPLSGVIMSLMGGHPINMYLFTIPAITKDPVISKFFYTTHVWTSYILIGLFTLHIAGFLFHLIVEKNNLLKRMV